jgi:argonaute-like protein implicated in RNA metabolism and viral defense
LLLRGWEFSMTRITHQAALGNNDRMTSRFKSSGGSSSMTRRVGLIASVPALNR